MKYFGVLMHLTGKKHATRARLKIDTRPDRLADCRRKDKGSRH